MSVARGRAARPAPADGDGADYGEVVGGLRRDVVPDVNGTQASPRLEARSLEARSLEGRAYRLPEDLEGEHNVVIVGFEWWQQTLIDSWVPPLRGLAGRRPGVQFYELVAVPRSRLPARGVIDGGMVAGIPDPEIRARTLTAYTDLGQLLVAAGLKGTADVAVLLTNRAGRSCGGLRAPMTRQPGRPRTCARVGVSGRRVRARAVAVPGVT